MQLRHYWGKPSQVCRVTCELTMNFDIELAEFVQIIHNGRGYWLTISAPILMYMCMYPSAGTLVRAQTAALLHTESPANRLKFMRFQMQAGGYDFGLFAAPGQFHFEQLKMQHHLWKCFENRKINKFPYNKLQWATELTVKLVEEVPVYCICRMLDRVLKMQKVQRHVFVFHPKPWLPALDGFVVCVNSVCII